MTEATRPVLRPAVDRCRANRVEGQKSDGTPWGHVCRLPGDHDGTTHRCYCGAEWTAE